jgi:hypothetical protein
MPIPPDRRARSVAGRRPAEGRPCPRRRRADRRPRPLATRAADPGPREHPRLLAEDNHPRRPQPASPPHDRRDRPPHAAAGPMEHRRLDPGGSGAGDMARRLTGARGGLTGACGQPEARTPMGNPSDDSVRDCKRNASPPMPSS